MLTTNGNNGKNPYTLREIVEIDYPEFWGGASETVRVVGELQNLAIELLPVSIDNAEGELIDIMTLVESLSGTIESFFDDKTGLSKLEEMLDTFRIDTDKPKFDFLVLPNWSYRDIMGSINNRGLLHEDLWNSVLNDIAPKEANIVALMERPEDNEMVRIY